MDRGRVGTGDHLSAEVKRDFAIMARTSIDSCSIALSEGWTSEAELQQLINPGCVCDTMFNFVQKDNKTIDHSINSCVTSVDLDTVKRAKQIVLSSGGAHRALAIRATIRRIECKTIITDEKCSLGTFRSGKLMSWSLV
jgi:DNA-binding transcriptional regulator LsrR (DeoR family)